MCENSDDHPSRPSFCAQEFRDVWRWVRRAGLRFGRLCFSHVPQAASGLDWLPSVLRLSVVTSLMVVSASFAPNRVLGSSVSGSTQPSATQPGNDGQLATRLAQDSAHESFDRATLVILAPQGPVLAEIRLSVAGLPYREWVGRYLGGKLDEDRSGSLTVDELDLLTQQVRQLLNVANAQQVIAASAKESAATSVGVTEFAEWMRNRLPRAFFIRALPKAADDAVRLSSLLDTDLDGVISTSELNAAPRALRFRDLDDDQTFSISELMPYRDPRNQDASLAPDAANLPFLEVTGADSADAAARKLIRRYGDDPATLPLSVLRLSPQQAVQHGVADVLSEKMLSDLLQSRVAHVVMEFKLSDKANRSDVVCTINQHATGFCQQVDKRFGSCDLSVDGLPLKLIARGGGSNNRAYMRGFLGQNFLMSDADRNQYLDEAEFSTLSAALTQSGVTGDFQAIDQNGDQMIVRDELFGFVNRDLISTASQIEVTVEQDGKTMFGLMDSNNDRRLSQRELQDAVTALAPYDRSNDGRFADEELGIEYHLTIGLGRPEVRRTNVMAMNSNASGMMRSGDAILPGRDVMQGPEWFRRMDRNQDGDISYREFVGTRAMFAELDQDNDRLISADEASAIDSRFPDQTAD